MSAELIIHLSPAVTSKPAQTETPTPEAKCGSYVYEILFSATELLKYKLLFKFKSFLQSTLLILLKYKVQFLFARTTPTLAVTGGCVPVSCEYTLHSSKELGIFKRTVLYILKNIPQ